MPAPLAIDASVIICAYTLDRWDDVLAAVASVTAQQPAPAEVVVVVDHNPELLARLSATMDTRVRVIPNESARGLSGARNAGVRATRGDIVVFLDDDAQARPGWLRTLLDGFEPDVMAVGGSALPRWDRGRPGWFPEEFDWVIGCTYRGSPMERAEVRNLLGANMSFRRSALQAAGGFEGRLGRVGTLPVGDEETELCIRARRAQPGMRIVLDPSATVDHRVPAARGRLRYFVDRCFGEGRSKAILVGLSGREAGLATERDYVRRTLPRGVLRGLRELIVSDRNGGRRAAAIVLGLGVTMAGYLSGRIRARLLRDAARPASS